MIIFSFCAATHTHTQTHTHAVKHAELRMRSFFMMPSHYGAMLLLAALPLMRKLLIYSDVKLQECLIRSKSILHHLPSPTITLSLTPEELFPSFINIFNMKMTATLSDVRATKINIYRYDQMS